MLYEVITIHLVEQRARFVSREEALELLWPDTVVSGSALFQVIKEVRDALEDDGTQQRWLRTLRGRGYRFVGELFEDPPLTLPEPSLV